MQAPEQPPIRPDPEAIIARLLEVYDAKNDAGLARALDTVSSTVGSWRSRGVPYAVCVDTAIAKGLSLDWLLFGIGMKDATAQAEGKGVYGVDLFLMREVIQATRELFDEQQLTLPPAKFAELCILAYELELAAQHRDPKARVQQLMRLAA